MAESVRHFIEAFPTQSMAEGDVYCTNNPWKGTGHLNDLVVTTPAFHHGRLIGLFSCTSHIVDLGGIGFGPDGTDVFMEGLSLPFLKLVDRGRVNETLMAIVKANTRLPVETEGDIYSLINCNEIGARRLGEMMTEFGLATLEDLSGHILESSRAAVLTEIAKLPRGSWRYEMTIDGYASLSRWPPPPRSPTGRSRSISPVPRRPRASASTARSPIPRPIRSSASPAPSRPGCPTMPARSRPIMSARRPTPSSMPCRPHRWRPAISSARCCPMSSSAACARQFRIESPPRVPLASIS
jgi:hypothetical protein